MSLLNKTIKAGSWQLVAVISKSLFQIAAVAVLARILSPNEFGHIAVAMIVLGFGEMFVELGFAPAIIQIDELTDSVISFCFYGGVSLGVVFVLTNWLAAPYVATFFNADETVPIIQALGFNLLITKFGLVSRAKLERELRFDLIAIADIFGILVGYSVAIYLAYKGFGVWSLVVNSIMYSSVSVILLIFIKPFSILPQFNRRDAKDVLTYGGGLTLSRIFNNIALQGDYIIVGKFLGSHLLGIYEKTFYLMSMPGTYLGNVVDKVLFPGLSRLQNDKKKLKDVFLNALEFINVVLVPFSVFMIVNAKEIIHVVLGEKWTEATVPLQILTVFLALRTSVRVSDCLVRATGYVYGSAFRKAIYSVLVIFGSFIGSEWGLVGVAVAINLAVLINYILMVSFGLKVVNGRKTDMFFSLKKSIFLGFFIFIVSFGLKNLIGIFLTNIFINLLLIIFLTILSLSIWVLFMPNILGEIGFMLFEKGKKKVFNYLN